MKLYNFSLQWHVHSLYRNIGWWSKHNGPSIMEKYDEDIYENPFFVALQNEYSELYEKVTLMRCAVCKVVFVLNWIYLVDLLF